MIRFLQRRNATSLGPLEITVMEILWAHGAGNVRDVAQKLERPLAYTTVMTTLDRLYKKGLLTRSKSERAFLYAPLLSRGEWEHKRAGALIAGFLSGPQPPDLLLSSLVDAVGQHDAALLDDLEKKIKMKRRELDRGRRP
jgi:predicted transcriptional regulator